MINKPLKKAPVSKSIPRAEPILQPPKVKLEAKPRVGAPLPKPSLSVKKDIPSGPVAFGRKTDSLAFQKNVVKPKASLAIGTYGSGGKFFPDKQGLYIEKPSSRIQKAGDPFAKLSKNS